MVRTVTVVVALYVRLGQCSGTVNKLYTKSDTLQTLYTSWLARVVHADVITASYEQMYEKCT